MQLNCKQGDLAIIVKSACGNEGKIVRCLELVVTDTIPDIHGKMRQYVDGDRYIWRIDRSINFRSTYNGSITQIMYSSDHKMRPLRGDLSDEEIETNQELNTVV